MRTAGIVFYFLGLGFSEALRVPRRLERARGESSWQAHGSRFADRPVVASVILGFWVLPGGYAFTDTFRAFDYVVPSWLTVFGAALFTCSLFLRWEAHHWLGREWTHTVEISEGHQLVTNGIYARVRHPLYASVVLWAVAQPFLLSNLIAGFSGLVPAALLCLVRVPREERMMLDRFGDAYRRYMDRTGRFVPKRRAD